MIDRLYLRRRSIPISEIGTCSSALAGQIMKQSLGFRVMKASLDFCVMKGSLDHSVMKGSLGFTNTRDIFLFKLLIICNPKVMTKHLVRKPHPRSTIPTPPNAIQPPIQSDPLPQCYLPPLLLSDRRFCPLPILALLPAPTSPLSSLGCSFLAPSSFSPLPSPLSFLSFCCCCFCLLLLFGVVPLSTQIHVRFDTLADMLSDQS